MTLRHEPDGYRCPFCRVVAGEDLRDEFTKQSDIVVRDGTLTAFVSSAWWPGNDGNVIVVPNGHYENVYAIPDEVLAAVQVMGKRIALAMMATYGCEGTSFRQHNGPGADQEVWHYHLHVIPRYRGDRFYIRTYERYDTTVAERTPFAERLRTYLNQTEQ